MFPAASSSAGIPHGTTAVGPGSDIAAGGLKEGAAGAAGVVADVTAASVQPHVPAGTALAPAPTEAAAPAPATAVTGLGGAKAPQPLTSSVQAQAHQKGVAQPQSQPQPLQQALVSQCDSQLTRQQGAWPHVPHPTPLSTLPKVNVFVASLAADPTALTSTADLAVQSQTAAASINRACQTAMASQSGAHPADGLRQPAVTIKTPAQPAPAAVGLSPSAVSRTQPLPPLEATDAREDAKPRTGGRDLEGLAAHKLTDELTGVDQRGRDRGC